MKISKFIPMSAAVMLMSVPAIGQEHDTYNSAAEIPLYLQTTLQQGMYIEQYISSNLQFFRQASPNKNSINTQDILSMEERGVKERQRRQVQQIIAYDQNFDGQVTEDEIRTFYEDQAQTQGRQAEHKGRYDEMVSRMMEHDINKDAVITIVEMSQLKESDAGDYNYGRRNLKDIMGLDLNGDGNVTASEVESQSRKAFRTLDKNQDDMLTGDEVEIVKAEVVARERNIRLNEKCALPSPPADAKIVFVSVYEGGAVSTVSVAGQEDETNVIPFQIDKGNEKLYIIAASYSPIVWQFRDDTSKVSHLLLLGPASKVEHKKVSVGAIGIPAEKITFKSSSDCDFYRSYGGSEKEKTEGANSIKALVGRLPDYQLSSYSAVGVHLFDGRLNTDISDRLVQQQKQPPTGFDKDIWQEHVSRMQGGLIDLKDQKIISDAKAEPYEVLPKWAGLAKLAYEKAIIPIYGGPNSQIIIRNDSQARLTTLQNVESVNVGSHAPYLEMRRAINGFKIVKDIPYYPSGLNGGFSTNFIVAKGVKVPKGSSGHSDVSSEETGELISGPQKMMQLRKENRVMQ